jgi:hypothetical protein
MAHGVFENANIASSRRSHLLARSANLLHIVARTGSRRRSSLACREDEAAESDSLHWRELCTSQVLAAQSTRVITNSDTSMLFGFIEQRNNERLISANLCMAVRSNISLGLEVRIIDLRYDGERPLRNGYNFCLKLLDGAGP